MKNNNNIVKPIEFAKEMNVKPQYIYAMIREGKLPSHSCTCGHTYLLRDELVDFVAKRAAK